jgi:hypothetical protein
MLPENYYIGGKTNLRGWQNFGQRLLSFYLTWKYKQTDRDKGGRVFYLTDMAALVAAKRVRQIRLASADSVFNVDDTGIMENWKQGCYITYGIADKGPDGDPIVQTTYAITAKLWINTCLLQNALIYIDANSSIADRDFVQLSSKKPSIPVFIWGWTGDVGDLTAYETSKYFSTELGANDEDARPKLPSSGL